MYNFEEIPNAVEPVVNELNNIIKDFLNIDSDEKLEASICALETIDSTIESPDDPKQFAVNLIADAIEKYENNLPELQAFETLAAALDPAISTLRVLMTQHNLKNRNLKSIINVNDSAMSMILNGKRELTRKHIEKLSNHFKIDPALFFDKI